MNIYFGKGAVAGLRRKALVCLFSFVVGLLSASAAPVLAQSSINVSPGNRISVNTGTSRYNSYNNMGAYQNMYNSYGTNAGSYNSGYNPGYNTGMNPGYNTGVNPGYNTGAGYNTGYPNNQNQGYGYQTPMGNQMQSGNFYNPANDQRTSSMYDQRYNRSYGTRYENSYYQGNTGSRSYELPGVIGAVAGVALGAATFGWMGAIVGGLAGYFIGDKIGEWMYPRGSEMKHPYRPDSKVPLISGLIGAVSGIALLSSFGMVGMAVGGMVGWMAARSVMKLVAPKFYYYGFQREGRYQYGTGNAYYYAPGTTESATGPAAASNTEGAVSGKPLPELQENFYDSMRVYRKALADNTDEEDIKAKRKVYVETQKAYEAARNSAINK